MQQELPLDEPNEHLRYDEKTVREFARNSLWDNPFDDPDTTITPQEYQRNIDEIYRRTPEYMVRDGDWHDLQMEQQTVREYYTSRDRLVPLATERRFSKQVAAFKEFWQIEPSDPSLSERLTLDDADLQQPEQSWKDLQTAHDLTVHYYAVAGLDIPDSTLKRFKTDAADFDREMTAYQMKRDMAKSAQENVSEFKKQLQAVHAQNIQQKTLKPH